MRQSQLIQAGAADLAISNIKQVRRSANVLLLRPPLAGGVMMIFLLLLICDVVTNLSPSTTNVHKTYEMGITMN
jgi:hypothetical protein